MGVTFNEIPIGKVDGVNRRFTLAHLPHTFGVRLYVGGLRCKLGVDYTMEGSTIVMSFAPDAHEPIVVDYEH